MDCSLYLLEVFRVLRVAAAVLRVRIFDARQASGRRQARRNRLSWLDKARLLIDTYYQYT